MKNNISTFKDLLLVCGQRKKRIYEIIQEKEAFSLDLSVEDVRKKVKKSLDAMKEAIKIGLKSNEKSISGKCGDDCEKLQKRLP